ncbi:MAG TPA: prepilin peptidase [Actinobacteria bacterium]|nr:prepilin peptidase [Actinomycetota bacterium]
MQQLAVAGSAVVGLLVGSFLNVVAYRIPAGISVTTPPSACPSCGHRIRPYDNIPVVSWLLLRGRCRDCRAPISIRYPLVEAGTAALFALTAALIGPSWVLPAFLWFAAVVEVLVIVDLAHKRIPNRILYPGTAVAVVLLAAGAVAEGEASALLRALAGGAGYFGMLLLVAILARGGFGFGDVKLAFLLGLFAAYRSWESLFVSVVMAFLVGGLISVVLLLARRAGRRDAIPFGPALAVGVAIGIAAGIPIADWYLPD